MRLFALYMTIAPMLLVAFIFACVAALIIIASFLAWDISILTDAFSDVVHSMSWEKIRVLWFVAAGISLLFWMLEEKP